MDYLAALDYLYGLGHETLTMKLGLENIQALMDHLGNPERSYPIVHVAGTNGKGSFCAMLASICAQAGINTALFTSPHLVELTERMQFNQQPISRDDLSRLVLKIKTNIDEMLNNGDSALVARPTFFEQITAIALEYFRECQPQLVILEVGLGGRLDSTNIVQPILSVITRVALDHQQYLGDTISEIAREKAGILKPDVPALIAGQTSEATTVIAETATEIGAPLTWLFDDNLDQRLQTQAATDGFWQLELQTDRSQYKNLRIGLRGRHQVETAALAIMTAELLAAQGFPIDQTAIEQGITQVQWPGRLEVIQRQPTILLDGAHNPDGIETLRAFLQEWLPEHQFQRKILLFSAMRDKDLLTMAERLFPLFDQVLLVERSDARSANFHQLQTVLSQFCAEIEIVQGVSNALTQAQNLVNNNGLIVAAGSLHLIGEIKKI